MYYLESFIRCDWGKNEILPPSRRGQKNVTYSRTYNNNNIFTFDTETTSITVDGMKYGFVYKGMLSINGTVWFMDDLNLFKTFLDKYDTPGTINVIYVHNLSFDFSFLQNVLDFDTVFARKARKVIFARYKSWEFRCSYFVSVMSLKAVGESYNLPHSKAVDALDYGKRRTPNTPLTELEEDYMEKDCLVLHEYVQYLLNENNGRYKDIPYTQTGFVRRFVLEQSKIDKEYYKLRSIVQKTKPSIELFHVFEKCYAGGYTHANYMAVTVGLHTHVFSYDFTSSYPAVMVRCMFPMGQFIRKTNSFNYYLNRPEKYCCVGRFRIKNIKAKTDLCYISNHKIIRGTAVNAVVNNGRLFKADSIEIYLTNVDVDTIKMMYNCDIETLDLWVSYAGYLPKTIINSVLTLYENKTNFKGVKEKESLYMASKQMINSIYGMSVFNPYCDEIIYNNGEWDVELATPEKLDKYYNNKKTILPYQWGVFITAHARQKLCNIASKIGNDVLYMDTDSIKFVGDYHYLFQEDNELIHNENVKAMEHYGFDMCRVAPKDIKGKVHELGLWDFEHEYKSFKVLGAKRYCYTLYGDASIYPVVAGCNIQALKEYLMNNNCNALLREFKLDLFLDTKHSGKNCITYHRKNYDIDIDVRDYLGNVETVHIGYGAHVEPTTFDMSMADDYLKFLCNYAVSDKMALVRNGVVME